MKWISFGKLKIGQTNDGKTDIQVKLENEAD